jgi:3'-5' exoribonuclease
MLTERCPINAFQPGDKFERVIVAVRSVRGGIDRNGKPYADLKVADWSCSRSAKIWKVTESEINALTKADFLEITGLVDNSEQFSGQFTINRYAIAPVPDDITEFLEIPPPTNREYRDRFLKLIKSVGDTELRTTLRTVFGDEPFRRKFFRAYAASGVHHAFPGGLLEHTVEVAELCSGACQVLNGLDRDLLVAGALLHDIGKMDEMNQELRAGEYTDDGCLIGHIVLGAATVSKAIARHNDSAVADNRISASTERALVHLILSHHGLPEHGAARKPAFAEAGVLYLCDNISAKSRQFMDLVAQNTVGATSAPNRFLDTQVYLKPVREAAAGQTAVEDSIDYSEVDESANTAFAVAVLLPVLGLVAAGSPDEKAATHPVERRSVVPPPSGADFLLNVSGDSMIDAGIQDGDIVFVRKQDTASDGDIVVAHIPGEGQTVKRLCLNPQHEHGLDGPYLEAANSEMNYKPLALGSDACIQGKVTGLLRDL